MKRLEGKAALVTGAGRGLGRVIALRLAEEGAAVVLNYAASREGAMEAVEAIRKAGGHAVAYQADITRREDVIRMFEAADRDPGRLDIVVNNAGVGLNVPLAKVTDEQIAGQLGINFLAPLYVGSEAAKRLGEGGRIVNIGSTFADFPTPNGTLYASTKAALKKFTEVWAKELGSQGVTVNTVIPGATSPGMIDSASDFYKEVYAKASPFGRYGRAEEVAAVVAFLCSPEGSWVSGTHIMVNGAANM
jgi:3-oxoacyl-[acyl-carrier protein] reductase